MKKIETKWKNLIGNFPITIISILVATTIHMIGIDAKWITSQIMEFILAFLNYLAVTTFFLESRNKKVGRKKYLEYALSIVISLLLSYLTIFHEGELTIRIITCYIVSLLSLSVYDNYKNSNQKWNTYVTQVLLRLLKSTLVYGVLAIGVSMITSVFCFLILSNDSYLLVLRLQILLLGGFYFPKIIEAISDQEEEKGKFFLGMIQYVLEPLVIIAFLIIYLYLAKILILRDIPSNQIFRILATLFILGCPIWTMGNSFKEKNILDKINHKLPLLFIPFLILQIYSVGVRILSNGMTEARYLCIMLIIFEIIYIIIYHWKKEDTSYSLLVIVVLTVITTIVPYINAYHVSILSQCHNLKIYKEKSNYTEKEKIKIQGAYEYLKESKEKEKYIEKILTKEDIEKIQELKNKKCIRKKYYYATKKLNSIDVSGYHKLSNAKSYNYKGIEKEKLKELSFQVGEEERIIDVSKQMNIYIENRDNLQEYLKTHFEIEIDERQKLIIGRITFRYDGEKEELETYSISGYLLEK